MEDSNSSGHEINRRRENGMGERDSLALNFFYLLWKFMEFLKLIFT